VGRSDVDGIDLLDEGVEIVEGIKAEFMGKSVRLGPVGIEDGDDVGPAHYLGFRDEPVGDPAGSDDANLADILCLGTKLGAGDTHGTRQVDHLAVLVQVIELSHPVGPDGEDINVILLDIIDLLPYIVLDDHLIGIPGRLDGLHPLKHIVPDIELPPPPVEAVARHPDDQIIAELLRATKEVDVALVEKVVSTVCYYFDH